MQIPILSGIATDENADFRTAHPRNLVPVPKSNGISNGYLRPAPGIIPWTTGPGVDRGAIEWNGVCYRVMGTKLVSVSATGEVVTLGDVGGSGQAQFDYSFDRLAVCSSGAFFYWDGSTLTEVTDADLGDVLRFIWVDGYFLTTDGENQPVTELNDPTQVDALKYGSSEVDPDAVKAVFKISNEPIVVNRHTIESFRNVGGTGFPYQRNEGAMVPKGSVGSYSCCVYNDAIAMLGGGRNEAIAVWAGLNGQFAKLSSREIDQILEGYSLAELESAVFETRVGGNFNQLRIRLPDRTLVYDSNASAAVSMPVWFEEVSALDGLGRHRCANAVFCYGKWIVGDTQTAALGYLSDSVSSHWGERVGWEFTTPIIYNEGRGGIIHEIELVGLPGRVALGANPQVGLLRSSDGITWGSPRYISAGSQGSRDHRLRWLNEGRIGNYRIQRCKGTSDCHMSFARMEARIEPLEW